MSSYKAELKRRKISYRKIATDLSLSAATVNLVLDNKYTGSKDTEDRIIKHIEYLIQDKEDMNLIIYNNIDTMLKATHMLIKNPKLNNVETRYFIKLNEILNTYKENQIAKI
jgi:hypothetical protein